MLFESTAFNSCEVFDDGVRIRTRRGSAAGLGEQLPLSPGDVNRPLACSPCTAGATGSQYTAAPRTLSCRLVLDCMGHYSPIVKQMRGGAKPQGMVVVVGGCMGGVPQEHNTCADLLYSMEDSVHDMQVRQNVVQGCAATWAVTGAPAAVPRNTHNKGVVAVRQGPGCGQYRDLP